MVLFVYQDINDHPPIFTKSNYTFNVFENVTTGYIVGTVSASDQDEGSNAVVTYRILSPTENVLFRLDQHNPGDILVAKPLNREDDISPYTLQVNS